MSERRNRGYRRLLAIKERQRAVGARLHHLPFAGR
jgi:hypothetical protein